MTWITVTLAALIVLFGFPLIFFFGAPFMPSYRKKTPPNFNGVFKWLRESGVNKFVDLGSGDGRVVIEFAKAGFESYGVEINPLLVLWSKRHTKKLGLVNAHISLGNLWHTDLKDFDCVFIFHFELANKQLVEKFKRELKDGAIIISTGFHLNGLQFIKKEPPFLIYKK